MYKELVDVTRWILELFPATWLTAYKVKYDKKKDKIVYAVKLMKKDNDDNFQIVITGAKKDFFEKTVAPRLREIVVADIDISYCPAGLECYLITFEPQKRRKYSDMASLFSAFVDRDFSYALGGWVSREEYPELPPQG